MRIVNRVPSRGKFRCRLLIGVLVLFVVCPTLVVLAEDSDPAPSPLYQQSLQSSIQKFKDRDQGGGGTATIVRPAGNEYVPWWNRTIRAAGPAVYRCPTAAVVGG